MVGGRRREKKKKGEREEGETNFPNIPEEIILEILSRLPLEPLVRFACVSKQWCPLVKTVLPKHSRKQNIFLLPYITNGSKSFFSFDGEGFVEANIPQHFSYTSMEIYGSCNGLLLIANREDLFLWSPLNGYCKKVLSYFRLVNYGYRIVSGLCYDSCIDEYKAVMALSYQSPGEFVMVGNFRSKSWIEVEFPYNIHTMIPGPIVNENLHWNVSKEDSGHFRSPRCIVYFNPRTNIFNELPMPQPNDEGGDIILGLGALHERLCMVRNQHPSKAPDNVEVLIMKRYGDGGSWTSMFIISNVKKLHPYDGLVPLCFTRSGEALIQKDGHLWTYDPKTKHLRLIPTD